MGLCPGYRHVNLRTELGQPLPLATIFLLVVVKDYVPDGLSDFAEALANPIKYQSDLEKRDQQLAVFTDDMEEASSNVEEQKKSAVPKVNDKLTTNGSPVQRPSISAGATSVDLSVENEVPILVTPTPPAVTTLEHNSINKSIDIKEEKQEEICAETLEKIMENKLVKEKKIELDKKLETLRKKHEKKKITLQSQKSGDLSGEKRSKLINMKLVKRLSSKNM